MTGDQPKQITTIANSGARPRTEEDEALMLFDGAMLMPTAAERFSLEN